jgi:hypothetical protein
VRKVLETSRFADQFTVAARPTRREMGDRES